MKLKNSLVIILIVLLVSFTAGYYFGYNAGFTKAAQLLIKSQ